MSFLKAHAFELVLFFTVAILFQYAWGRRRNVRLAKEMSRLLEKVFAPKDQNYTWIGGLSGFRGEFVLPSGLNVQATLVMRPWHSLLFLPISLLFFGGDRLFINVLGRALTSEEGHAINQTRRGFSRGFLPNPSEFPISKEVTAQSSKFTLLARDDETLGWLTETVKQLKALGDQAGAGAGGAGLRADSCLFHLATMPGDKKLYLALHPKGKGLESALSCLVEPIGVKTRG